MTKSLTEQWKDGTIKEGLYYVKTDIGLNNGVVFRWLTGVKPDEEFLKLKYFKEVLAPVPTWEEDKEKTEKLHLANEMWTKWYNAFCEKQKEINKLQEQLKEANELISLLYPLSMNKERAIERTAEYMEKWGVK